jgi:alpha-ketoglutarate-dependent taurine dioxygenase
MARPLESNIAFSRRRKIVTASDKDLVRTGYLNERRLPLVVEPQIEGLDLVRWAEAHRDFLDSSLNETGAILFRNFGVNKVEQFETFVEATCGGLLEYKERSSPRSQVSGNVFTSTDYPPDRSIFPHTEQSYNQTFPLRIAFYCVTEPQAGGETPIADTRRVFQRIRPETRERFEQLGYLYVRNFGSGVGLSWREAFQTTDPKEVEKHCRNSFIDFEWLPGGGLRTRQLRPVVAQHPSGALAWFNHLTFFHVSTLESDIQKQMLENFSEDDLPNNTYYGDGSRIEPKVMEELRAAYLAELTSFPWRTGDVLLLDNVLTAHARSSFLPPRKVVVAMARPSNWGELAAQPLICWV